MSLKIAAVLQRCFCLKIRAFLMFTLEIFSKFGWSRHFISFHRKKWDHWYWQEWLEINLSNVILLKVGSANKSCPWPCPVFRCRIILLISYLGRNASHWYRISTKSFIWFKKEELCPVTSLAWKHVYWSDQKAPEVLV